MSFYVIGELIVVHKPKYCAHFSLCIKRDQYFYSFHVKNDADECICIVLDREFYDDHSGIRFIKVLFGETALYVDVDHVSLVEEGKNQWQDA